MGESQWNGQAKVARAIGREAGDVGPSWKGRAYEERTSLSRKRPIEVESDESAECVRVAGAGRAKQNGRQRGCRVNVKHASRLAMCIVEAKPCEPKLI